MTLTLSKTEEKIDEFFEANGSKLTGKVVDEARPMAVRVLCSECGTVVDELETDAEGKCRTCQAREKD